MPKRRIVIAGTGASGSIYLQRLLTALAGNTEAEVHLILSDHARQVIAEEIGELRIPESARQYHSANMHAPFTSGSHPFDAMAIIPCSMGTIGRIAAGTSDNNIIRAADVFLKERRTLLLVPRETPWNLIHGRNIVSLMEAGATVLPAIPSFYSRPKTLEEAVDTVVFRVLDHLGFPGHQGFRWKGESE